MARLVTVLLIVVVGFVFGLAFLNPYWAKKQLQSNRKVKARLSKWLKRDEPGPVTEKSVTLLLMFWWGGLSGVVGAFCAGVVIRGIQPFRLLFIAALCAAFGAWVPHHLRAGWLEKQNRSDTES